MAGTPYAPDTLEPPTWGDKAACRDVDRAVFFPRRANKEDSATARWYCQRCPVTTECLELALRQEGAAAANMRFGIFGGATPTDRRRIHDERTKQAKAA